MGFFSRLFHRKSAYLFSRVLLGGILVFASWDKILDPAAFARIIDNYQILSTGMGRLTAFFLPWLELVCGICLIINRWTRGSAVIVAGLMVVFVGALGYNIYQGIDISCGCFTLTDKTPGSMWFYLLRDVVFLAMAIGVVIHAHPEQRNSNPI
ncbi:MAG: MauE/DoxX family redox-associated membrane protein [Desulfobacteraceae bacterium]|jgi:uncharacterized membrane protein YphA (DoxX/SURF4 family)